MAEENHNKNGDGEPSGADLDGRNDNAGIYHDLPALSAAGESSDLELEYMQVEETLNQTKSARKVTSDEIHWKRVSGEKVSDNLQQRWQEITAELESLEARKSEILRLLDQRLAGEREKRKSLAGVAVFVGRGKKSMLLPALFTLSLLALAVWSSLYFLDRTALSPGTEPEGRPQAIQRKPAAPEAVSLPPAAAESSISEEKDIAGLAAEAEKPPPPPPPPPAPMQAARKTPEKPASTGKIPPSPKPPSPARKALPAGETVKKALQKPVLAVREPGKPERRELVPTPAVSARNAANRRKEVLSKDPSVDGTGKDNPLFRKADSFRLQNNYAKAEETYIKIIETMPGEGRVFIELGDLYLEMGLYSRAKKMYDQAAIIFQARR